MPAPTMRYGGEWLKDPNLREHATERQRQFIDAVLKHGTMIKAAAALAVRVSVISEGLKCARERAAAMGHAPGHFNDGIAPGYRMGKVTIQRANGQVERVWERQHPEDGRFAAQLAAIAAASESLPRLEPMPGPDHSLPHLLNLYVFTDYHLGMRAWRDEGGADWDMAIAEALIVRCFERMIASAPQARVGFIAQLGDFLHFDSLLPVTPTSGHIVDAAAHYEQIVGASLRIMRRLIDFALARHDRVVVLAAEGNHDITGSMWLRVTLQALYEHEPRLQVIQSAKPFYAYEHGRTMLAFHHGHGAKLEQLPLLFADQFDEMWGRTKKRYAHAGHYHHELQIKELSGMRVLQHPTLAPNDSYAARHGYNAIRQASVTTYHDIFGKASEQIVTPEMLAA